MSLRSHLPAIKRAALVRFAVVVALVVTVVATVVVSVTYSRVQQASVFANETVLRVSRLAGYSAAKVGVRSSEAVVWLRFPTELISAADVALAWESGMAMLSVAYPKARSYRVDLAFSPDRTLVTIAGRGRAVREAVSSDDPQALREALRFRAVIGDTAEEMPSRAASTLGRESEFDAMNRSSGLTSVVGPSLPGGKELNQAWLDAYRAAPGVPAPTGGAGLAVRFWSDRMAKALSRVSIEGERELAVLVPSWVAAADVVGARSWAAIAGAIAEARPVGGRVLGLTAAATRDVAKASWRTGGPGKYERRGAAVANLARAPSLDASASVEATAFPNEVLARFGVTQGGPKVVGLAWRVTEPSGWEGEGFAGPVRWLAYRASDGSVYWLAGEDGKVALTDSSLLGWGYRTFSASLVDADDVSRVVATFPEKNAQ